MRLLLDECISDRSLTGALIAAGHDVASSIDELGGGVDDLAVFTFARQHGRIIVTYNNADFKTIAEENPLHPGVILVYQNNRPTDMTVSDILNASSNVATTYRYRIAGQIVVLNAHRW